MKGHVCEICGARDTRGIHYRGFFFCRICKDYNLDFYLDIEGPQEKEEDNVKK